MSCLTCTTPNSVFWCCCFLSHLWQALFQPHLIFPPDNTLGNCDLRMGAGDWQKARKRQQEPSLATTTSRSGRLRRRRMRCSTVGVSHACVYFDVVAVKLRDVSLCTGIFVLVLVCVRLCVSACVLTSDKKRIKQHNLSAWARQHQRHNNESKYATFRMVLRFFCFLFRKLPTRSVPTLITTPYKIRP